MALRLPRRKDAETGRAVAATLRRVTHAVILPKILGCSRPQAEALLAP